MGAPSGGDVYNSKLTHAQRGVGWHSWWWWGVVLGAGWAYQSVVVVVAWWCSLPAGYPLTSYKPVSLSRLSLSLRIFDRKCPKLK